MVVWNRFYVKLKINSNFYVFFKKKTYQQNFKNEKNFWKKIRYLMSRVLVQTFFLNHTLNCFEMFFNREWHCFKRLKQLIFFHHLYFVFHLSNRCFNYLKKNLWRLFLEFNLSKWCQFQMPNILYFSIMQANF